MQEFWFFFGAAFSLPLTEECVWRGRESGTIWQPRLSSWHVRSGNVWQRLFCRFVFFFFVCFNLAAHVNFFLSSGKDVRPLWETLHLRRPMAGHQEVGGALETKLLHKPLTCSDFQLENAYDWRGQEQEAEMFNQRRPLYLVHLAVTGFPVKGLVGAASASRLEVAFCLV